MSADFVPLYRRCVDLTLPITAVGDCFTVAAAQQGQLCSDLSDGNFTRLIAIVGTQYVQVGMTCEDDQLKVTSLDPAVTIPPGTELFFDWSAENMADLMCEADKTLAETLEDLIKSDTLTVEVDDDGKLCIETKAGAGDPVTWESCGYEYTGKGIERTPIANPSNVDGQVFDPPRVTIVNGKPVFTKAGCAPLMSASCDPCLTDCEPCDNTGN